MSLLLGRTMPPRDWLSNTVKSAFSGHGWGDMALVVDDQQDGSNTVIVMVAFPGIPNPEGAIPKSKFAVTANHGATREEIERVFAKAVKKAAFSLHKQIEAEKAKYH